MKRANKQEMDARTSKAAELLAIGQSATVVTTQVAEIYGLSRRQARRICAAGMSLIVKDFDEINIERPQRVAKLIVTLEQGMQKGLLHNQSSGVAACAKQIINLAGLAAFHSISNMQVDLGLLGPKPS